MGKITTDKRAGFTLMELMVYIAIVGIVVIVAGQAFSNSTKMRVRTQSMLKASEVAENVATLFKTDVAQMGAKSSLETHATDGSNDTFSGIKREVYMDPKVDGDPDDKVEDLSSFKFVPASPASNASLEKFITRRVRYDAAGKYQSVEEITWFLDGKTLKRQCVVVDNGTAGDDCAPKGTAGADLDPYTVEMATDVDLFQVLPAIPDGSEGSLDIFPPASGIKMVSRTGIGGLLPVVPGTGGTSVQLTGFASNYDENSDEAPAIKSMNEVYVFENSDAVGTWKTLCENASNHFSFEPNQEYELSFGVAIPTTDTEKAKMFVPGKDHMAVGFRTSDGEKIAQIPDFMFYPPSISEANGVRRTMRFMVPTAVNNACLAFTFSFFSPLASTGTLTISDLRLKKIATSTYRFDPTTTSVPVADRKNVKAFQLRLKVKRNGESGEVTLVIPTPSNGPTD